MYLPLKVRKNILNSICLSLFLFFINSAIFADSSGVDPYQTMQSFLSAPSDATRESVVEMTRSIFTKPYENYNPEIYAPSANSDDLSIAYLEQLFGTVPGVLAGSSTTLLSQMFYVFNMGIFAVVGLVLSMIIVTSTVNTGGQGQFMGRRNQNPYWIWFRSFTGVSILMPTYNGYSLIQVIVIWVAVQGIGLSNAIWSEVQNIVYKTNSILSYVKLVDGSASSSVANIDPVTEAEQQAYNRCLYKSDRDCTATGGFIGNSEVVNALSLTQMLIMYQSCLDYNLKKLQNDYENCMKVAGNFDNISCYPPKKEDLYSVNYSTYQITYIGPKNSNTTHACGNIYMTPQCSNKSSCQDYEANYDKNLFDAFITLFNAAAEPADSIFQYYDQCNEDDPDQSCYNPPNSEYSANCINPDGSVNQTCTITNESVQALNDLTLKATTYQMDFADNAAVTEINTGEDEKGYADALGFMDGGWILAGNSYGTLVYFGAKSDSNSMPLMNVFRTSLSASSFPNSLKNVYQYLTPVTGSVTDVTGQTTTTSLSYELTLEKSLIDWSNPVSTDEIASAQKEKDDQASSKEVVTSAPITQCITGDYYYKDGQAIACNAALGGEAPDTTASEVDQYDCGKNDYSMRYLSCIVTSNISKGNYRRFTFNAGVENNWNSYLKPTYDIAISLPLNDPPDWEDIATDYFNGVQTAWVLAMFGGTDVRNIVDPIYRMRMLGINLINYSAEYVHHVVKDTLTFVQNTVWDFYFGYLIGNIFLVAALDFTRLILGGIENTLILVLTIVAAIVRTIWLVGPALYLMVMGIIEMIKLIFIGIFIVMQGISVVFNVLSQLFPLLSQIVILSGTQYFTLYLAIAIPILVLGGYLAGYLSMVPYLVFLVTVAGWFLLILESSIAAPIIALGVTYPQGHDFFGRAEQLLSMMLNIFIRPACILIGFLFGIMMASMSLFLLNAILFPVIINYMGFLVGSDFLSIQLTNFIQGVGTSPINGYSGGIIDTFIYFLLMLLYAYTASSVLIYCFSLTYMIPYQLTRWVDPRAAESPEEVRGSMDEIKQSFVGEVIGGLANSLTSLFALTSMFAQTAQMAPSGSGRFNAKPMLDANKNSGNNAQVTE